MAMNRIEQLYRQVILEESRHPRHHGHLDQPTNSLTVHNPSCGDTLVLDIVMDGEIIQDVAFSGSGCTISQASASMMMGMMVGKTRTEMRAAATAMNNMIVEGAEPETIIGDAAVLASVHEFPARVKCALLAWKAADQIMTED